MDINELMEKAMSGDAHVQFELANAYAEGEDIENAEKWYKKALLGGVAEASEKLLWLYSKSFQLDKLKRLIDAEMSSGHCDFISLMDNLEKMREEQMLSYDTEYLIGDYLSLLDDELLSPEALYRKGFYYLDEENYERALKVYTRLVETPALAESLKFYFLEKLDDEKRRLRVLAPVHDNSVLETDFSNTSFEDLKWKGMGKEKKASKQNYLGGLYQELNCPLQAIDCYEKASNLGNAQAQYNLAICYYKGYGVEKSYDKAWELCDKASEQLHYDARVLRDKLENILNANLDEEYSIANAGKRYDIFISWNHRDKEFKDFIVKGIEEFDFDDTDTRDERAYPHYRAWESDRDASGLINKCIENAINKSKYFMLLLSSNSIESPWVEKEIGLALDRIERGEWTEENIIIVYLDDVMEEMDYLDKSSPFLKLREYTASFRGGCEINADDARLVESICNRIKNGLEAEAIKNYVIQQTEANKTFKASIKNQFDNSGFDNLKEEDSIVGFIDAYLEYEKGYVERDLIGKNGLPATLDDIAGTKKSLYIYGAGGTGKSLYISNLIKKYFNNNRFFIRLNLIDYEKKLREANSLTAILNDELNRYLTDNDEYRSKKALVRAEGQNNQMTVVLDGLDEINKESRDKLIALVSGFACQNRRNYRFIFISRSSEYYDDVKEAIGELDIYTLSSFGRREQEKLYNALNQKTKGLYSEEKSLELKESFFEMIDTLGDEISKNPFLLSNLIFVYLKSIGNEYPKNKLSLVASATEMFIKDMDEKKHISFEYPEYMVKGEIRKALEYIAFKRQLGNGHSFKELLIDYFNTECKLRDGHEAELVGVSVYNYLYRRNIITESKITHDIFTAYFASCYLYGKIYERVQLFFDDAIVFNSNDGKKYFESAMRRLGNEDGMWREIASELIMKLDSEIYALDKNQKMNESNPSYEAFDYTLTKAFTEKGFSKGAIDIVNEMCQKQFGFYFGEFIKSYI